MNPGKIERIHFVGIGGTGMSGLAEILLTMGYQVSGSDLSASAVTERLSSLGAKIYLGHEREHALGADLVVISSAIGRYNPELRAARESGTATLKRGEVLAEIMRLRNGIAVAGSHGKTTTTSLTGHLLTQAGLDPTVIVGGQLKKIGSNALFGRGDYLVAEADESDRSFLDLQPTLAVVTNIDREHLDRYRSLVDIRKAFLKFMRHVPFYGLAIVCGDDPNVRAILPEMRKRVTTYGFGEHNRLRAVDVEADGLAQRFTVLSDDETLGRARVTLPGRHNIQNALAAIAVGLEVGIEPAACLAALDGFDGVGRRCEVHPETAGMIWIDDYAHHPTELAAILSTVRSVFPERRLLAFFQPHRYSRVQGLAREFAEVLGDVDQLVLSEIYPGGEKPLPGVTTDLLIDQIRAIHEVPIEKVNGEKEARSTISKMLRPGDLFVTLGAGTVSRWGRAIVDDYSQIHGALTGTRGETHRQGSPE